MLHALFLTHRHTLSHTYKEALLRGLSCKNWIIDHNWPLSERDGPRKRQRETDGGRNQRQQSLKGSSRERNGSRMPIKRGREQDTEKWTWWSRGWISCKMWMRSDEAEAAFPVRCGSDPTHLGSCSWGSLFQAGSPSQTFPWKSATQKACRGKQTVQLSGFILQSKHCRKMLS